MSLFSKQMSGTFQLYFWVMFFLLWSNPGFGLTEVSAVDSSGHRIVLEQPARRIISLAPHISELLFAAGAGPRLVGVDAFSDYPPATRDLPRVGDAIRLDRERIIALQPDLIVAWGSGNPGAELQALRKLGIPVFVSELRRLEDIPQQIEALGNLTGNTGYSRVVAERFRNRLMKLRSLYAREQPVDVFYQISGNPLYTINGEHMVSSIISLCGGVNIFAGLPDLALVVSLEAVVAAAPEVILYGESTANRQPQVTSLWSKWPTIPAVAKNRLFGVPADLIHRPGPRILQGVEQVCALLETVHKEFRPSGPEQE